MVHLSQAQGEFVLPDRVPEHVLFVSGGSGITPVMSMLRSLQRRTHRGRVTFVHYAQSPDHQIFAAELDEIRRSGHGVDVHLLHPELGDPNLSPAYLERLVPGYRDVPTWACGPAPLIEAVRAAYDGAEALRVEYFQPPRRTSGTSAEGDVAFARSGQEAPNSGATLLEQAEALGLKPEFGCRMGICFSCTARKKDGHRPQRPDRRGVLLARRGHPRSASPPRSATASSTCEPATPTWHPTIFRRTRSQGSQRKETR